MKEKTPVCQSCGGRTKMKYGRDEKGRTLFRLECPICKDTVSFWSWSNKGARTAWRVLYTNRWADKFLIA